MSGIKPFRHRIVVVPTDRLPARKVTKNTKHGEWKSRALKKMRMLFYFQILKAEIKFKRHWWNNYCISRVGAPGRYEFLCRETFYVASIIDKNEAEKYRGYWIACYRKSIEILNWLWSLQDFAYTWKLHQHLKQLIVIPRPILSEVERYEFRAESEVASEVQRKWSDIIHNSADKTQICTLHNCID